MTAVFKQGDRIKHVTKYKGKRTTSYGTVDIYITANGNYRAMVVVEWDDDSRGTLGADDVTPEGAAK